MRKIIFHTALLILVVLASSAKIDQITTDCEVRVLKSELIKELRPDFKYDSSNISRFLIEDKKQGTEVQVPLFSTEKYRLLFNTAALPVDVEIKIYDKKVGSKNRKLLYSNEKASGKTIFVFEPETPKTMYIDYILPGDASQVGQPACVVFLLGYKVG